MKKSLLIVFLLFISGEVISNIAPPKAFISEIYIDLNNKWSIELGFPEKPNDFLDSLFIETSSGSFKVMNYQTIKDMSETRFPYLVVLTNSNLEDSLTLNRLGDFVKVKSFLGNTKLTDMLAFGNYPNSKFAEFKEGHSIAYIEHFNSYSGYYSLDNSPTLGKNNDTDGIAATIKGYLYNSNNEIIPNREIWGFIGKLVSNEQGYFEGEIISQTYVLDTFSFYLSTDFISYIYEKDSINAFPDSVINKNLILYSIVNDIPKIEKINEICVSSFPNPFVNHLNFIVDIPYSVKAEKVEIQIFDIKGRLVASKESESNRALLSFSSPDLQNLKAGLYLYALKINDVRVAQKNNQLIKVD